MSRDLQRFVDGAAAQAKWTSTRAACGVRSSDGHLCGKAAGHKGVHVCRCVAERALESMGAYVGVAS